MATAPPPVPATDGLAAPHSTSRPAPRGREARQAARVAPPATAADTALPRQSFFARNRARRAGSATATAIIPAPAVTPATATSIGAYTLTASAIAARLPGGDMAMLADVIAAAALRAMAAALGLTGTGVAVIGPDGDTHAAGNSAKIAMLLAVVEGESIESFRAAGGMPVLAAAPPGLAVTAAGPGSLAIEPRLPLALTADGSAIAPSHAARFLDSLVKELESL